jgi:CubicO group peptidase (beta-lactamase class C family)
MLTIHPEDAGFSSERLRRIATVMQRFVDRGDLAGTLTLLARQGRVAYCATTGQMDIEAGRPMQADAIFRIYSMTKPITVVAALMLMEEGNFLLEDPVANWVPEFAHVKVFVRANGDDIEVTDLQRPITIRHLFTHSAGLSYGFETGHPVDKLYQGAGIFRGEPLAEKMQRLCQLPLVQQPGTGFWYSMAHDVLGHLIELISGRPLDVFFQERIFDPLGMVDTGFNVARAKLGRLAVMYAPRAGGGLQRAEGPEDDATARPPWLSGGGGLLSTAADYLRFAQMLLNRGELDGNCLLSRKTFELLTTPHLPFPPGEIATNPGYSMGLGVAVLTDLSSTSRRGSVGSFGWGGLAGTRFWVDPQEEMVGILMAQTMPGVWRAADLFESLAYAALI